MDFKVAAILISACITAAVAITVAIINIRHNKQSNRRQATLSHLLMYQLDPTINKASESFRHVRDSGLFDRIKSPVTADDREKRNDLMIFLNHYELIFSGINEDVLDEKIIKRFWKGTVIRHWEESKDLVMDIRKVNDQAYVEFQRYAESWGNGKNVGG